MTGFSPSRVSHLIRGLDPKVPSNRYIIALTGVAAIAGFGLGGGVGAALRTAGVVFFAWALGRELDPDRAWTAGLAATLVLILTPFSPPAPGATLLLLVAARILLRSTGLAPTRIDLVGVLAVAILFAHSPGSWAAGLAVVFAVFRDAGAPARAGVAVAIVAALAVTAAAWPEAFGGPWVRPDVYRGTLLALGLAAGATLPAEVPASTADYTGAQLDARRLRWSRWTVLAALSLAAAVGGSEAIRETSAGWTLLVTTWLGARMRR